MLRDWGARRMRELIARRRERMARRACESVLVMEQLHNQLMQGLVISPSWPVLL